MNTLNTPDDVDDFFEEIQQIEGIVMEALEKSKHARHAMECAIALMNLSTSAYISAGGTYRSYQKLAKICYNDSKEILEISEREDLDV